MVSAAERVSSSLSARCVLSVIAALALAAPTVSARAGAPQIRISADNAVPHCVTPQGLMAFLKSRNASIEPRFEDIAKLYKLHGEAWKVRWDYAFFQMAVETNFLSFRRGDGSLGDVRPHQNNFAGLGTTGGGVAGDSYPDVNTGVLAQIQHLVVYSGQRVAMPVGARTRLRQDDILDSVGRLKRRATFSDLSRRWAADRHYGANIEWVADSYRAAYCRPGSETAVEANAHGAHALERAAALGGPTVVAENAAAAPPVRTIWRRPAHSAHKADRSADEAPTAVAAPPETAAPKVAPNAVVPAPRDSAPSEPPAEAEAQSDTLAAAGPIAVPAPVEVTPDARRVAEPSAAAAPEPFAFAAAMDLTALSANAAAATAHCRVFAASYGGRRTLLVRAEAGNEMRYTALTVLEGFESSMLASYLKAHAPGGSSLGVFDTKEAALARARKLCAGTAKAPSPSDSAG